MQRIISSNQRITYLFYSLILLLSISMIGCKNPTKKETTTNNIAIDTIDSKRDLSNIKIGYCSPSLNAPFYVALSDAIQKNVEAYNMHFLSVDGRGDITKQVKGIEDLISKGVNALIINPLDPKALVPVVNRAVKAGIPVFTVDSYMSPKANYSVSVLADNEGNGELLGQWIVGQMKSTSIKMCLISGAPGNHVGREKRLGIVRGIADRQLKDNGEAKLDIVAQGWGKWTIRGGLKAMEDILSAHPNINVAVAENDAMAMGALKAIEGSANHTDIMVVGFDGQKEALKLIKEGKMAATALNSPSNLAQLVVQSIVRYLNGTKSKGKVIHTKSVLINKSNVDKYYNPNALF